MMTREEMDKDIARAIELKRASDEWLEICERARQRSLLDLRARGVDGFTHEIQRPCFLSGLDCETFFLGY